MCVRVQRDVDPEISSQSQVLPVSSGLLHSECTKHNMGQKKDSCFLGCGWSGKRGHLCPSLDGLAVVGGFV